MNDSIFVNSTPENENCSKWPQFGAVTDRIEPTPRDGKTDPENLITACGGCNYGEMDWMLEQLSARRPSVASMPPHARQPDRTRSTYPCEQAASVRVKARSTKGHVHPP